ncbi:MAG TPA: hypothetical protein VE546_21270 [Streptomyces sp.]|uniref:hypothetical protein n=1 Tax=Streptomyces sp. TaxID=1931 RepID=UPI002D763CD7|nr:hypothetical protein [Streptomyces sp.]HZG06075.1 hypothetical protein [Streptomyces sp.]
MAVADPIARGARAAAQRLTTPHAPSLPADVEAALHARDGAARPDRYLDPVSLASLVVSVATLAWTVYNDLRTRNADPGRDVVTRHVRVRLDQAGTSPAALGPADRDRIVDITVEETLNAARDDDTGQD